VITNLIGDRARSVGLPAVKRAAGVVTRLLPIPQPTLLVGPGSSGRLGQAVGAFGHRHVLLVTDRMIAGLGLLGALTDGLRAGGTAFTVFDEVTPDAPIPVIERGIDVFQREDCDAIVAFGGGSVMDAAKVIGLAAANDRHPRSLVGYFRGLRGPVPIYAVPTTAGTGSEVTVAAVISDPEREKKLVIADTRIVPEMAALDPSLMVGLPKPVTAATGMDALTHAVEAFIGHWNTSFTDRMALAAVGMIFENLPLAYANGANLEAREQMALASTYAGLAFTRANVGNVHAIAHQLGAKYHTPHGLANAIMLPQVLRFSSTAITGRLATLALHAKVGNEGDGKEELADRFLDAVEALADSVGIPRTLDALREEHIAALAAAACWEADTGYPVPRRMTQADCEAMLRAVLPPEPAAKPARKAPRKKAPSAGARPARRKAARKR
jgi:alcohol dehydrogenase